MLFSHMPIVNPGLAILSSRPEGRRPRGSGDDGARTRDLVVANHALSQLSYIPPIHWRRASGRTWIRTKDLSFIRAAL